MIIGAGDTGERVFRYLTYEGTSKRRVVGFLDDDPTKRGQRIHGVPVLGSRAMLSTLIRDAHVLEVLVAINDPPGDLLQFVQRCCETDGIGWKVVTAGVTVAA